MADDLRQRYAAAILARLAQTGPTPSDYDIADAVMAVRDEDLQAWQERAENAEAAIARAENLRDKWLAWPEGDMHHAAGLMLSKYLSDEPPALDNTKETERG